MIGINDLILLSATKYIGIKEKPNNYGFYDEEFDKKMELVGFNSGESWCALFAELVWKEAYSQYNSFMVAILDKLFSDSAVKTFSNFSKSSMFTIGKVPEIGSLVVWQKYLNGEKSWQGHIGIFTGMIGGKMLTIEGNTNDNGSREGDGVYKKTREINYFNDNGLRLLGFVNPKS